MTSLRTGSTLKTGSRSRLGAQRTETATARPAARPQVESRSKPAGFFGTNSDWSVFRERSGMMEEDARAKDESDSGEQLCKAMKECADAMHKAHTAGNVTEAQKHFRRMHECMESYGMHLESMMRR